LFVVKGFVEVRGLEDGGHGIRSRGGEINHGGTEGTDEWEGRRMSGEG
jgi:hypothetical protein